MKKHSGIIMFVPILALTLFSLTGCGRYSLSRKMERFMAKPIVLPDGLIRIHGSQIDTGVTLSPPYYIAICRFHGLLDL